MTTQEWARREIELACENEIKKCKEDPFYQEGNEDWGVNLYLAAGDLVDLIVEQGHTGYSAHMVKEIFSRLIDGKVLTPVTDEDDQWNCYNPKGVDDDIARYQHKRMSSLFKRVDPDGTVTINDINRVRIYDKEWNEYYSFKFMDQLINEIYPITFPYIDQRIVVFSTDISAEGTPYPDIMYVEKAVLDDTHEVLIDRYFQRDDSEDDRDWIEIDDYGYFSMKHNIEVAKKELEEEKNNG